MLAGDVVRHPVDPPHLVDDAVGDADLVVVTSDLKISSVRNRPFLTSTAREANSLAEIGLHS
jgi:hypothetical protein